MKTKPPHTPTATPPVRIRPGAPEPVPSDPDRMVDKVRERYGRIATGQESGCCGPSVASTCGTPASAAAAAIGYRDSDLAAVPEGANLGLGCGAPLDFLDLMPGETVLDLGSGAGFDAFLAARHVSDTGRIIGVDMTPEMVAKARANAAEGGFTNVEFRQGRLESLPLEDASVDAVTSNCVINLVPDKSVVFREIVRVLRPGGRLVISDILLDGPLPMAIATDVLAYVGCVAGAIGRLAYFDLVRGAGLTGVRIHKDVDYLAAAGYTFSKELQDRLNRDGITTRDLEGKVRSVTWSAVKSQSQDPGR
jgi:arsenite methyltransferase